MFEGFTSKSVETSGAEIRSVIGGGGPPLLLLHGYPQTHATDLRGRGLPCGHDLAEEAPAETLAELLAFFAP